MAMRWSHLDLGEGVWSKPASATKQKSAHTVPLSAPARLVLSELRARGAAGDFVFPSPNNPTGHITSFAGAWATICRAASISGARIHDLRHTNAALLAGGGTSWPQIGALLGHASPSTSSRYAHLALDPLRVAAERVGTIIANAGDKDLGTAPLLFPKRGRRHGH